MTSLEHEDGSRGNDSVSDYDYDNWGEDNWGDIEVSPDFHILMVIAHLITFCHIDSKRCFKFKKKLNYDNTFSLLVPLKECLVIICNCFNIFLHRLEVKSVAVVVVEAGKQRVIQLARHRDRLPVKQTTVGITRNGEA